MNSRERTRLALNHTRGDRIPVDFWASRGTIRNIERHYAIPYERFLDERDVDFRYIAGPRYIGPPLEPGRDIWGVLRTQVRLALPNGEEDYEELLASPLAGVETPEEVARYPGWPSPDDYDYGGVESQCDAILAQGRVVVFMGDRLNRIAQLKPAMYLRGMEAIFMDMALHEALAAAVLRRVREFYTVYLERLLLAAKGKIDIVLTGDDFGSQNGLLVSREMWQRFIRPGFAEYLALIKAHGARTMHHTCGSVVELIPDMIECGLDVLQSVQPEARGMSLTDLRAHFGRRLAFQGGISIQKTLPFGTVADVREAVRCAAATVKPGGGYIFCTAHNIQADTPMANIEALLSAYAEFG